MREILLVAALLCSSCTAQETDVIKEENVDPQGILRCYEHGSAPGDFCRVSMLQLITSRGLFDGRQVIVAGFIGNLEGDLYLFPTREFYLSRDLASSVRLQGTLESLKGKEQKNVVVFGSFSLDAPDTSAIFKPVGAIAVLSVRNGYNKP